MFSPMLVSVGDLFYLFHDHFQIGKLSKRMITSTVDWYDNYSVISVRVQVLQNDYICLKLHS